MCARGGPHLHPQGPGRSWAFGQNPAGKGESEWKLLSGAGTRPGKWGTCHDEAELSSHLAEQRWGGRGLTAGGSRPKLCWGGHPACQAEPGHRGHGDAAILQTSLSGSQETPLRGGVPRGFLSAGRTARPACFPGNGWWDARPGGGSEEEVLTPLGSGASGLPCLCSRTLLLGEASGTTARPWPSRKPR